MRFKKLTTWVVLADGARARILENTGPGTGLVELEEWESAEARKPTRELGTERPGRGHESATEGRHAIAPHGDWHEMEKVNFANDLARYLKRHGDAGKFDQLVLAAPPRTLGELQIDRCRDRQEAEDRDQQGSDEYSYCRDRLSP